MTNTITTYWRVFLTFARNSLVRDMTLRGHFVINTISSLSWPAFNVVFYQRMFAYTDALGKTGWGKYEFFAFFATGLIINALAQMFFMTNIEDFADLIRTGDFDFLLLKLIDTQFLISLKRIEWSSLGNFLAGIGFLIYSIAMLSHMPGSLQIALFLVYVVCGVAIYYSLMIALGAATVWMGRNLTLMEFWFYITNFSRYPMEIYSGRFGEPLRICFTYLLPILIVINVPARMIVWPLGSSQWPLAAFAILATVGSVAASRWLFQTALNSYRSASS